MKTSKMLLSCAELCALILLLMLLFIDSNFDYVRALFCFVFAISAVILQSMQQNIAWSDKNEAARDLTANNDKMQSLIDEAQAICRKQQAIISDAIKMLNDAQ